MYVPQEEGLYWDIHGDLWSRDSDNREIVSPWDLCLVGSATATRSRVLSPIPITSVYTLRCLSRRRLARSVSTPTC